jgi:Tol biopolymer transport system component
VEKAGFPVVSPDGTWLAYLRTSRGRGTIWLRNLSQKAIPDRPVTPPDYDVEEMTFLPRGTLIFSASTSNFSSGLYILGESGVIHSLVRAEARFPAVSPDGNWLTYSRLQGGVWNLWIRDLRRGTSRRLTDEDCNHVSPLWEPDSKTLIYASDCGRALWFTALHRRQVVP